jgi:26S proteasome non-ATPase regulatory subunit 9
MGFTLPSPTSPAEQARTLMTRKDEIEAEIEAQLSILKANSSSLHSPLVDAEGFPRADIDVYAVRASRVRIIELRNDLDAVMGAIGKALEGVYDPTAGEVPPSASDPAAGTSGPGGLPQPFAKVDGVAPSSPAAEAVRHGSSWNCCRALKRNRRVSKGKTLL